MCGIIGLVGSSDKFPLKPGIMVYRGLLRLEYRGYDSAGVGSVTSKGVQILKGKGSIRELEKKLCLSCIDGAIVIGHTRWATHGAPSDTNAHPHTDCNNKIAVVHNGIIQNYQELRDILIGKGHIFRSETDTEVVPHLIEEIYRRLGDFYESFKRAISMLKGSYAIVVITSYEPDKLFFAKKDSPLIIGLGDGFNLVASDIPAILEYTRYVITLRDNWIGYVSSNKILIEDLADSRVVEWKKLVRTVEWSIEDAVKGGYPHFMIKEIHEQPRALKETLYGVQRDPAIVKAVELLARADNVYITGAGTSYHACYYYSILSSILAKRLVYSFIASEYSVYASTADKPDVLIVVSQSGETMDALKALRAFKEKGVSIIAVSNVVDSAIPRESDLAVYTRAGPEIGVAATKTFTTQTLVLSWLSIALGQGTGALTKSEAEYYRGWLKKSAEIVAKTISWNEALAMELADWMRKKRSVYYLSRGIGVPIAMEGALKLKEIAYIHAEAYPAGESKHGPIALVEEDFPVIFIVPEHRELEKALLGNIQEMKARGASIIGVAAESTSLSNYFDYWFKIPSSHWILTSISHILPQQLLAYYTSVKRGFNPDRPRNLAKTVTVE